MLYKTTIVIWSDFDPTGRLELADLARDATSGDSYCSKQECVSVSKPEDDPDWDGTEFFGAGLDEDEDEDEDRDHRRGLYGPEYPGEKF